ncbi:hypothetical protein PVT68_05550 [Microbulbifer bruguierae]|uniref:Uncharacterized protein n=1 Tax=Microbulbifer bruguierae TaxID=3029061 RepID=A0ABY8NG24_9GAMM|nr:hypothetical protein [Microbulbifer bruguierae]WGL17758.1 hypothetical protein PVT68_05550 [Microbulbifer bruguierae]
MPFEIFKDRNYALYLGDNTIYWVGIISSPTTCLWCLSHPCSLQVVDIRPAARNIKGGGVLFQLAEGLRYLKCVPKFLELFIFSILSIAAFGRGR